ncbi:hypothetical protein IJ11_0013180 [Lacticaseibacillus paracasei]|nr:hypothetical protein IJ11_0013180 [Lacticaseibacillus paracasei]CAD7483846.1 conserved hypothetical protein [Lacticaseibacillus paracasei]
MKGNLGLSYVDFEMREQAQKPTHKDLRQEWAKASRQCAGSETREQAQKPAHKDLKPKWPKPSHFRLEATYAPVSNRACSRSVPFSLNGI